MQLDALNAFVKVVQAGSFTRAAETLATQKAHLSRVVAQLEKDLGVRLLERTTRSLSLTEVGRELFERAVGILGAVEEAERVVQQAHAEPRGTLRLTCGVEFGMLAVSTWIDQYLQRYPHVRVEADFSGRVADLVHDGFDLAVRIAALPDSGLAARRLGDIHYGLFAAPAYLARFGEPLTVAELADHRLIVFSGGSRSGVWQLKHRDGQQQRIELSGRLHVNNSFAVRDAALAGLGIAMLPLLVAGAPQAAGQLQRLLPAWAPDSVPVHAVFPSARYLTPKVRAFIDLALAEFPVVSG